MVLELNVCIESEPRRGALFVEIRIIKCFEPRSGGLF
jgi:hypothetical protein